jgi:hypothetical protein
MEMIFLIKIGQNVYHGNSHIIYSIKCKKNHLI